MDMAEDRKAQKTVQQAAVMPHNAAYPGGRFYIRAQQIQHRKDHVLLERAALWQARREKQCLIVESPIVGAYVANLHEYPQPAVEVVVRYAELLCNGGFIRVVHVVI